MSGFLFHVSERSDIAIFSPRSPPSSDSGVTGEAVWAIDEDHLAHYLLPRECPRVCLRLGPQTSAADRARFFKAGEERVIAVEFNWYARIVSSKLFIYRLPPDSFAMVDQVAGYFISRVPVVPAGHESIARPVEEIVRRGYKLRLLPELWSLRDAVVASTMQFSVIRMRNAEARP